MIRTPTQNFLNIKLALMVCLYLGCLFLFRTADVRKLNVAIYNVNATTGSNMAKVELSQGFFNPFPNQDISYLESIVSN
ncbi:MAG: hypothetical protein OCD76_00210 [Reichenbachiella sp.]